MTVQELDRLVTKTEITPASKRALKEVRQAIQTGFVDDPQIGRAEWSVALDTARGLPVRMKFSFKRQ